MKQSYIKYIIALLLFGSNGIVASFISMDSYEIVFSRTMLGSLLLLTIFLAGKGKFTFYKYKKQFLCLAVSGVAMGRAGCCFTRLMQELASVLPRFCITVVL